jgi:hypothetical protein
MVGGERVDDIDGSGPIEQETAVDNTQIETAGRICDIVEVEFISLSIL